MGPLINVPFHWKLRFSIFGGRPDIWAAAHPKGIRSDQAMFGRVQSISEEKYHQRKHRQNVQTCKQSHLIHIQSLYPIFNAFFFVWPFLAQLWTVHRGRGACRTMFGGSVIVESSVNIHRRRNTYQLDQRRHQNSNLFQQLQVRKSIRKTKTRGKVWINVLFVPFAENAVKFWRNGNGNPSNRRRISRVAFAWVWAHSI